MLTTFAEPTRTGWRTRTAFFGALFAAAIFGACRLEFILDDAFIAFRYVSNARDGFGLVWNPPPFEPVEGYTSFLWNLLLWATWSWFGVEPPDAANVLSILCGLALLAVTAKAALGLRDRHGSRVGDAVAYCTRRGHRQPHLPAVDDRRTRDCAVQPRIRGMGRARLPATRSARRALALRLVGSCRDGRVDPTRRPVARGCHGRYGTRLTRAR